MADPWQFWSSSTLAAATGSPESAIRANWPVLCAALEARGISDRPVQIAAIATTRVEAGRGFAPIPEYASGDEYEGRADLGNVLPGDGRRYKGRGLITKREISISLSRLDQARACDPHSPTSDVVIPKSSAAVRMVAIRPFCLAASPRLSRRWPVFPREISWPRRPRERGSSAPSSPQTSWCHAGDRRSSGGSQQNAFGRDWMSRVWPARRGAAWPAESSLDVLQSARWWHSNAGGPCSTSNGGTACRATERSSCRAIRPQRAEPCGQAIGAPPTDHRGCKHHSDDNHEFCLPSLHPRLIRVSIP